MTIEKQLSELIKALNANTKALQASLATEVKEEKKFVETIEETLDVSDVKDIVPSKQEVLERVKTLARERINSNELNKVKIKSIITDMGAESMLDLDLEGLFKLKTAVKELV